MAASNVLLQRPRKRGTTTAIANRTAGTTTSATTTVAGIAHAARRQAAGRHAGRRGNGNITVVVAALDV